MTTTYAASEALRNQERLARLTSEMSHNVNLEHAVIARRRVERLASALGVVASLVALYDLSLMTNAAGRRRRAAAVCVRDLSGRVAPSRRSYAMDGY